VTYHILSNVKKVKEFSQCAFQLGQTPAEKFQIFWWLTKNLRVGLGLAKYHPYSVYQLPTKYGNIHLRDNFGDVTNLPDQVCFNVYQLFELEEDGPILDIGANIGLFAFWANIINPGREIHCIEPLNGNTKMIKLNCPQAKIYPLGLGKERGTVQFEVDDHSIMASSVETGWHTQSAEFQVLSLDDFVLENNIDEIAFMKIDTEGMELDILDGGKETFKKTRQISMETHGIDRHQRSLKKLDEFNFTITGENFNKTTGIIHASQN